MLIKIVNKKHLSVILKNNIINSEIEMTDSSDRINDGSSNLDAINPADPEDTSSTDKVLERDTEFENMLKQNRTER